MSVNLNENTSQKLMKKKSSGQISNKICFLCDQNFQRNKMGLTGLPGGVILPGKLKVMPNNSWYALSPILIMKLQIFRMVLMYKKWECTNEKNNISIALCRRNRTIDFNYITGLKWTIQKRDKENQML